MNPETTAALAALDSAVGALGQAVVALRAALDVDDPQPPAVVLRVVETTSSSITVEWSTSGPDPDGWTIGRDGVDTLGTGGWATRVTGSARTFTFSSLRSSTEYTVTLVRHALPGLSSEPVSMKATTKAGGTSATGDTAAERYGWGKPHPISDEFDYAGPPDPTRWILPGAGGWDGHNGNGRRMPDNVFVRDGIMTLRGDANGHTGWVRQRLATRHGRWEIRSRSRNTGGTGGLYHPLHLIWPSSERWPADGEYDWIEYTDPDARDAQAFLHYPHDRLPVQQIHQVKAGVDMTRWHNFAFEWTDQHLAGWIDGAEWYRVSGGAASGRRRIQDMPSGALTVQLDNFTGDGGLRPAVFEIDWVRFYPL